MKITLESTKEVQTLLRGPDKAQARIWRGETEDGIPVVAWIALIQPQTHDPVATAKFDAEMTLVRTASEQRPIDIRFVI